MIRSESHRQRRGLRRTLREPLAQIDFQSTQGHKGFDASTELAECPELSRTVTKTEGFLQKITLRGFP
jgi:hypothetical protein